MGDKQEFKTNKSTEKNRKLKEKSIIGKIFLVFFSSFFTFASVVAKLGLTIYDIIIPRSLRELVPILNLWRKYFLATINILAGKKSDEIIEISQEIDELLLREQRMLKAFPVRRGIGEVLNLAVTPIIFIAIPTAIAGDTLLAIIEDWSGIKQAITIVLFGTGLLLASWIATIFGPTYALFHECSIILLRFRAYRWASFYQKLENFFALPYYAAKSSFSFFDSPPINTETFQYFKLEIMEEIGAMKKRVRGLLSLDNNQVPLRAKERLEMLLKEAEMTLEELDIAQIKKESSRVFALIIWDKEKSILPWKNNEALKKFAQNNQMPKKEAKGSLEYITRKAQEEFISQDLFSSVIITGALKGIAQQEEKYKQLLPDLEYNIIAVSLALGAQQYIKDQYKPREWYKLFINSIYVSIIALFVPFFILFSAIFKYIKHVFISTIKAFYSLTKIRSNKFISMRYQEIRITLADTYKKVTSKGLRFKFRRDLNINFSSFWKGLVKLFLFLISFLLFIPLFKSIYNRLRRLWKEITPEEKLKRQFENDLSKETLISMYQELYNKMILSDYSFHSNL